MDKEYLDESIKFATNHKVTQVQASLLLNLLDGDGGKVASVCGMIDRGQDFYNAYVLLEIGKAAGEGGN